MLDDLPVRTLFRAIVRDWSGEVRKEVYVSGEGATYEEARKDARGKVRALFPGLRVRLISKTRAGR